MLLELEIIEKIAKDLKQQGKKIVFTNGCFDILHLGHINYLRESKKLGDILIVGLNSDSSVKKLKGESRPINTQNDRAELLCALKFVDFVCLFSSDTPINLIEKIIPDVLTKGGDYTPEKIVGYDFVTKNGGQVVIVNFTEGKSTTSIISKSINSK